MQHAETSRLRVVAAAATDARRDDGAEELAGSVDGVASPGRYIKEQRKRQGMSIDQLAAATKIPRTSLEFLEADEHDALPGPVFVKGFLRCCARALGIEAEVVMELVYERERALLVARRRERPASTTSAASPVPDSGSASEASAPGAARETAARKADEPHPERAGPSVGRGSAVADGAGAPQGRPGVGLFGGVRRRLGRGGFSMMLWAAVAMFVAMVMMAAFNMLGAGPIGPT